MPKPSHASVQEHSTPSSCVVEPLEPRQLFSANFGIPNDAALLTDANVIVATASAYGAIPDDGLDDTAAIQAAIAAALDGPSRYAAPQMIYLPDGVYDISDTLESKSADTSLWDGWRAGMILVGESEAGTILKLGDNLAGFTDPLNPKAVIKTGSEDPTSSGGGNRAFRHSIMNLTIDVGQDNPGAIGIDYIANNRGAVENVTIKSTDPDHDGHTGISMLRYGPGPALLKEVTIDGFDYGLNLDEFDFSMTVEGLDLSNQQAAGVRVATNVLNLRDVTSTNSVPALEIADGTASVTLLDSTLSGGAAGGTAISNTANGELFVRNVTVDSYGTAIDNYTGGTSDIAGGASVVIDEFVSQDTKSLFGSASTSLGLEIQETPTYHTDDVAKWLGVQVGGVGGATPFDNSDDDAPAIQAAIDAAAAQGAEIVYLPSGVYHVESAVVLRGGITKLVGMQSAISPSGALTTDDVLIRFDGGDEDAVIMEHLRINGVVEHNSDKTLVIRHADLNGYRNTSNGTGDLFIEDVIGRPYEIHHKQDVWMRQVNTEFYNDGPFIQNYGGGSLWVLGLKTEGEQTTIETRDSTTELLGALLRPSNPVSDTVPALKSTDSNVSYVFASGGDRYPRIIEETRDGETRSLWRRNIDPSTIGLLDDKADNFRGLPLFVGHDVDPIDLVMHLRLNEATGTLAEDSSPDGVELDNDGTLVNGATFVTGGARGAADGAVLLDGVDDGIRIEDGADVSAFTSIRNRTVSVWFKADDVTVDTRKQILYEQGGSNRGMNIYLFDGRLYAGIWNNGWNSFVSAAVPADGQWHHAALTLDVPVGKTSPDAFKGYLDGAEFGSAEGRWILGQNKAVMIGSGIDQTRFHDNPAGESATGHAFDGMVDDARVYNRTLDAGEVFALHGPSLGSIAGVTNIGYSSRFGSNFGPDNIVDRSGIDESLGTHDTIETNMWISQPGDIDDGHVTADFDLGGTFELDSLHLWNFNGIYNGNDNTDRGASAIDIWIAQDFDDDGIADTDEWVLLSTINPLQASGTSAYAGEFFDLDDAKARFIRLDITANHGSNFFTGLSEVEFFGMPV